MQGKSILIAEDEELMLKALSFKLKKEGYAVDVAGDGKVAMELVTANNYDLILSDIMMPFLGGLEIISAVKNDPTKSDTPIIILSAVGLEKTVLEAFELGADDFIVKPFNLNELSIRIKRHIRK